VAIAFTKPLQNDLGDQAPASSTAAPVVAAPAAPPAEAIAPVEKVAPVEAVAPVGAASPEAPLPPTEIQADITAEEALAFESTIELAPTMLTVTASVDSTSEQLHDMFDGNDW
jgi:hypothetical protein